MIRVGQVYCERGKQQYRPGEQPRKPRLWLVVNAPHPVVLAAMPEGASWQATLVNLESGGVRRVNVGVLQHPTSKRAFELWLDVGSFASSLEVR